MLIAIVIKIKHSLVKYNSYFLRAVKVSKYRFL